LGFDGLRTVFRRTRHSIDVEALIRVTPGDRLAVQCLPLQGRHLQLDVLLLCDRDELQRKVCCKCVNGGLVGSGDGERDVACTGATVTKKSPAR